MIQFSLGYYLHQMITAYNSTGVCDYYGETETVKECHF